MKSFTKLTIILLTVCLSFGTLGTIVIDADDGDVNRIVLYSSQSGENYENSATLNGVAVPEYDYTWHADPGEAHDEVKNSPAEYYTGTKPSGDEAVYIAHDTVYYPEFDESKFQKVNYDGETEWVYMYEAE